MNTDPASTHSGPAMMDRTAYLAGIRPGRNRAPDMGRNRTAPRSPMDMKLHWRMTDCRSPMVKTTAASSTATMEIRVQASFFLSFRSRPRGDSRLLVMMLLIPRVRPAPHPMMAMRSTARKIPARKPGM